MKTSNEGVELIKQFEGCKLTAYKAIPTEKYFSIAYGHYGADVKAGMKITQAQAEAYLRADLERFERAVEKTGVYNINEFSALVSFAYNCGEGNLNKLLKGRTHKQIADAILLYDKAGGKVLAGLTRRRKAERELFLKPVNGSNTPVKTPDTLSMDKVVDDVIKGVYGTGEARKKALEKVGYNYKEVQAEVNKRLKMK